MATTIRELLVKLGVDVSDAGIKKFDKGLDRVKTGMGKAIRVAAKLTGVVGVLGGAFGAREILDTITNYERLREQLRTVLGDADTAQARFGELTDFAAKTPFQLDGITEAFIRMQATGLKPTITDMKDVGDFAAAFGKDITEFADAVIGATTGESERLKQFGVIARQEAKQVKFTFDGQTKVVKRNAADIKKFLLDMARTRFAGAMERQSKTLGGAISTLKDNISLLIFRLGEAGLRRSLTELVAAMTGMTAEAEDLVDVLGMKLASAVDHLRESLPKIRDQMVEISKSVENLVERAGGLDGIAKSVRAIVIAFAAGKAVTFLSSLTTVLSGVATVLGGVTLAAFAEFALVIAGVVAQVTILFFAIDDLIVFFQGGDSALGRLIERFRGSNTVFGRVIVLFEKIGALIQAIAAVAFPILQAAAETVFRIWLFHVQLLIGLFTLLFDKVILPLADKFIELFGNAIDYATAKFGVFGVDVVGVFDSIFGAINTAIDALETFLGIAEPINLGMSVATATANGAAAPTAEAGNQATGAQARLASMSMGGDQITIPIDARGMNAQELATNVRAELDARDRQKRQQTRERFRGGDA